MTELGASTMIEERIARAFGSSESLNGGQLNSEGADGDAAATGAEGDHPPGGEKPTLLAHVRCERLSVLLHEITPSGWPRAGAEAAAAAALVEVQLDDLTLRCALVAPDEDDAEAADDGLPHFDTRATLRRLRAFGVRRDAAKGDARVLRAGPVRHRDRPVRLLRRVRQQRRLRERRGARRLRAGAEARGAGAGGPHDVRQSGVGRRGPRLM